MTAFLFIPATAGAPRPRRVDFANIASLFAEAEAPQPRRDRSEWLRIILMIVILMGAIGDTLLVARPGPLTGGVLTAPPAAAAHGQATAL